MTANNIGIKSQNQTHPIMMRSFSHFSSLYLLCISADEGGVVLLGEVEIERHDHPFQFHKEKESFLKQI